MGMEIILIKMMIMMIFMDIDDPDPLNPSKRNDEVDSDRDGFSDVYENKKGMNPNYWDSDKDGVQDGEVGFHELEVHMILMITIMMDILTMMKIWLDRIKMTVPLFQLIVIMTIIQILLR
jgi:hypothetical protein